MATFTNAHFDILLKLFVLTLLAGLGWQIGRLVNDGFAFIQQVWYRLFKRPLSVSSLRKQQVLPANQRQFLFDQLYFYKFLKPAQRKVFDHRTIQFAQSRTFVEKDGVVLTDDMKLLIAATSVQLTFGLRSYMLNEFRTIVVYPDVYLNHELNQYHKGETNQAGSVTLSWKHFKEGVAIPDDNLNLGIHEFAHTLAFQRLHNNAFRDVFFEDAFDKLMKNVSHPGFRKRIQQRAQFRSYALTNPMEFFAVATEVFFENPYQLMRNHATIYKLFVKMYNQDLAELFHRKVQPLTHSMPQSA